MDNKMYPDQFEPQLKTSQHYLDLLDSTPDPMYWIDHSCNLVGCNIHFFKLLNLNISKKLSGTPYELMLKYTSWNKERIEELKLDDMQIIFSGQSQTEHEEAPIYDKENHASYFRARRIPIVNSSGQVIGLAVTLTDITELIQLRQQTENKKAKSPKKTTRKTIKTHPHVLMVEDNAIAQQVEQALLTKLNCKVDIAPTGDKALEMFNPGKYDMILMDIGLEDTSGYMVAKKIRAIEKTTKHHVPILALTSFKAEVIKNDCKEHFMDGALSKPITNQQAEQLIKHYIHHEDIDVDGLESASEE